MSFIRVESLTKEFRQPIRTQGVLTGIKALFAPQYSIIRAVDHLTFHIERGELVGYIGRNGAGKSTTIKILAGLLVPTSGVVEVGGIVPWRDRARNARQIGVVWGQRSQLWWDLPLIDSLSLVARMYGLDRARAKRNLERFVALLDLDAFIETPVRQLSLGQRMRGDIVASMLYEPSILYLDEPTVGLDVLARGRIREFIQQVNRDTGTTVILTTHDLADVERLCNRIILVDDGRVLYDGSVGALKRRYAPYRTLVVRLGNAGDLITSDHEITVTRRDGDSVWLRFDPARTAISELIAGVTSRNLVSDLSIEEPELEDVVRQIYLGGAALLDHRKS